jgi:hypothetical protein
MTETGQRYVIKCLHAKKFRLDQIVARLASVYENKPVQRKRWNIGYTESSLEN